MLAFDLVEEQSGFLVTAAVEPPLGFAVQRVDVPRDISGIGLRLVAGAADGGKDYDGQQQQRRDTGLVHHEAFLARASGKAKRAFAQPNAHAGATVLSSSSSRPRKLYGRS